MSSQQKLISQGNFLFKYRSYWPVGILACGLAIRWFTESGNDENSWIPGLILCIFGFTVRGLTIGYAAPLTSGRNTTEGQLAASLNTTGMYSLCRHPLYLGNFLIWIGVALQSGNPSFVLISLALFGLIYRRIMLAEEAFLKVKFGKTYDWWASATPTFLPRPYGWKKPSLDFSWTKVLFQEKSGLLNLTIAFWLFHEVILLKNNGTQELFDPMNLVMGGVLLSYLILKVIQKRVSP